MQSRTSTFDAPGNRPGVLCGFSFAPPLAPAAPVAKPKPAKQRVKNDPRYVAFARELRDRYLDQVNADPGLLLPAGKYEVARALPDGTAPATPATFIEVKALPAAA